MPSLSNVEKEWWSRRIQEMCQSLIVGECLKPILERHNPALFAVNIVGKQLNTYGAKAVTTEELTPSGEIS